MKLSSWVSVVLNGLLVGQFSAEAFSVQNQQSPKQNSFSAITTKSSGGSRCQPHTSTQLHSTKSQSSSNLNARRKVLFGKKENYYELDRKSGRIVFGGPVPLANKFDTLSPDDTILNEWLNDEEAFAMGFWRDSHLTRISEDVYRLGLLTLQFVNLKFEPWVEVQVKTVPDSKALPVFTLQGINYDPNPQEIQFIPGMPRSLTLDDVIKNLDITVEVVGQVRQSPKDPAALSGRMVYEVTGKLPSALLLFPDPLLKAAADTITKEVVEFAQYSFKQGTTHKFKHYQAAHKKTP